MVESKKEKKHELQTKDDLNKLMLRAQKFFLQKKFITKHYIQQMISFDAKQLTSCGPD